MNKNIYSKMISVIFMNIKIEKISAFFFFFLIEFYIQGRVIYFKLKLKPRRLFNVSDFFPNKK